MGTCFSSTTSRTRMVDYYYDPALYDYDRVFPPYDVNHVNDLHLQEALASSLVSSMKEINHHPNPKGMLPCPRTNPPNHLAGNCTHYYCTECTVRYVESKIQDNVAGIKCPDVDCTHMIEPNRCRDLIPKNLSERWDKTLCESLIMSSEKVYCPFENCSAMMVVEGGDDKVTATECPSCHRLFCAQCRVTWHAGIGCDEFQRVGNTKNSLFFNGILNIITKGKGKTKNVDEKDELLIQLAKNKQWRRCPSCKYFVEKFFGCVVMSFAMVVDQSG
ncbi:hypothetical protein Bca52824_067090 [Brassica carinata]|uniref:RBR-type E3 ubiquitin transferase n=1 Tax=Brassica carinata TaxID=52824 RepID=A0A8X7UAP0_BRACI|nr:hypothetical protein Bca52824_067090 [Brassica carinata]